MAKRYNVAVVGATGLVGGTMISILEQRRFPIGELSLLASERSVGKAVEFCGTILRAKALSSFDFEGVDLALFSAGASVSEQFAPRAAAAGCMVIDNTSRFRYDDDIPLVVPEVNTHVLRQATERRIVANPNCSTIQLVVALKPIHDAVGLERINVATYQSVSGAGRRAVEDLTSQTATVLNGEPLSLNGARKPIAFNALPQIDTFQPNGYTREEMKMVWETQKILEDETIRVNPTAVRVPVFFAHSEAIHIETRDKITAADARRLLSESAGVEIVDETVDGGYPTAVTEGANSDAVFVGRIREDISHPRGLNMWVVSDNVRKGAALNSVQIAEFLVKDYL